jgi:threonine/homoserine/homoserine lactone efflux protein
LLAVVTVPGPTNAAIISKPGPKRFTMDYYETQLVSLSDKLPVDWSAMSIFLAMCLFALTMSVSPGPVNLVTFSLGLNYGFLPTLPFVAGAAVGFTAMLVLVGLGLGEVMALNPTVIGILTYAGTAFICYMGYRIATAHPELPDTGDRQPSFLHGAALQWLNPKAWIGSLSGIAAFEATPGNGLTVFAGVYLVVCFLSVAVWAFAGQRVSDLVDNATKLQWLNRVLGCLLFAVAFYLLYLHLAGGNRAQPL